MQLHHLNIYFFFLLFGLISTVVFFIFQPFMTAMVVAAILAIIFKKPYRKLVSLTQGKKVLSSLLTCLLVILIIVTPVFTVISLVINEVNSIYQEFGEEGGLQMMVTKSLTTASELPVIGTFVSLSNLNQENVQNDLGRFGENAVGILQAAYKGISHFVFWIFIMFFTLFYFLIDGERMATRLMSLSPLRNKHDKLLMQKFASISRATLKGSLVIGLIQGFIGGIAFWIAGVPSPALWGLVMVLFSLVPMVGPGIVWLPTGLILLATGNVWQGFFVLAVGLGIISVIDNILRPKLVGQDTQMHPLLVFFATIGGLGLFGIPGFIIGPIIVSLFLALSEIYSIEFRSQLKAYNE